MLPNIRKVGNSLLKNAKQNYLNLNITAPLSAKPQPILEPEVTNTGVSRNNILNS